MSQIRVAAHRIRSRCHQMKIEYYHRKYNNDDCTRIVSGRVPDAPFLSLRKSLVESETDDESTIDGDGEKAPQDLNADVTELGQPINADVQKEDNITLIDEHEFHHNCGCNCHAKEKQQMVSDVSPPVTANSKNGTTDPKFVSSNDNSISQVNPDPAELNYNDADMNVVTIVSNLETALDGVEVLDSSSANSVNSGNSSLLKQFFSFKLGKKQKGTVNIPSPIAECNSAREIDQAHSGGMNEEPLRTKAKKISFGNHILRALQPAPSPPVKRSFTVYNVVRPDHLYSKDNLLLPSEEAPIKDSPSPQSVRVSSSVYSDHEELTPPIHRLVRKTSFVRRSSSRKSSSGYSRTSALSAHSEAFAMNGNCQCVDCLEKYGINGSGVAWKVVGNRCSLQAALLSTGNAAAKAYGAKPLNADLTDCKIGEYSAEAGHQMPNNDSPANGKYGEPSNASRLKFFKLSKDSKVNETPIDADLKSSATISPLVTTTPVKSSNKSSLSPKRKSPARKVKVSSKNLPIDEHGETHLKTIESDCRLESTEALEGRIRLFEKSLAELTDPYTAEYQQMMNDIAQAMYDWDQRKTNPGNMPVSKENENSPIKLAPSTAGRIESHVRRERPMAKPNAKAVAAKEPVLKPVRPLITQNLNHKRFSYEKSSSDTTDSHAGHRFESDISESHRFASVDQNTIEWDEVFRGSSSSNGLRTFGNTIHTQHTYVDMFSDYLSAETDTAELKSSIEDEAKLKILAEPHPDDKNVLVEVTPPNTAGGVIAKPSQLTDKELGGTASERHLEHNMSRRMAVEERENYKPDQLMNFLSLSPPAKSAAVASIKATNVSQSPSRN